MWEFVGVVFVGCICLEMKQNGYYRIFCGAIVGAMAVFGVSCTHTLGNAPQENTPVGNVEALWQIIDEKYCFVEEKGIDWDSIHALYVDSARAIDTKEDGWNLRLFDLMAGMLNQLHDGHVNLYSPFDVSVCKEWYAGYPENFDEELVEKVYLQGARYAGGMYYNTIAGDSIGYIRYSSFSNAIGKSNMYYVLKAFSECRGIVLDVRHNGGGDLTNAYTLASTFMRHDTLVGYWQHKNGTGHNDFSKLEPIYVRKEEMPNKWYRPVVVLQDRHVYSAANAFVNCMRYTDNTLLLGGVSGGGGGIPMSYELPIGWVVRFSSVKMYDADKKSIEEGIAPHLKVTLKSTDKDDLIERAVTIINRAYDRK